jgi:hypothetical protein
LQHVIKQWDAPKRAEHPGDRAVNTEIVKQRQGDERRPERHQHVEERRRILRTVQERQGCQ